MSRKMKTNEINRQIKQLKNRKTKLENTIEWLEGRIEHYKNLKKEPLGPACPFCGKICKNLKGLKVHIRMKIKYEGHQHPHRMAYLQDRIDYTESGKIKIKCKDCGQWTVLNGARKDVRVREDGGFDCFNCRLRRERNENISS